MRILMSAPNFVSAIIPQTRTNEFIFCTKLGMRLQMNKDRLACDISVTKFAPKWEQLN